MDTETEKVMFALLRSAVCGGLLSDEEKALYDAQQLPQLLHTARRHDVAHLLALGLKKNDLLDENDRQIETEIFRAVYRYEQLNYEMNVLCSALEAAQIPFLPLKGAVIRSIYPEPWMRTSCDIDILVHSEDLNRAIFYLSEHLKYTEKERATHDVSMFAPSGVHVELHFDLIEEKRANNAIGVLSGVWDDAVRCEGSGFRCQMSDAFFYFYHIAHMAKHFEDGGCGIRPFLDLFLLDHVEGTDTAQRDCLLDRGGLSEFANAARRLSRVWFGGEPMDALSEKMQDYILRGGSFGTTDNRVAAKKRSGGRAKYLLSRMFIPYARLKRYYPILERHKWLMPVMQIRRWFMLLNPDVRSMAKYELQANRSVSDEKIQDTQALLRRLGL